MTTEQPFVPEWYWRDLVPINGEINGLTYQNRWEQRNENRTKQVLERAEAQGWCCFYCGLPLPEDRSKIIREHRIARSKGGRNSGKNIVASCPGCDKNKKTNLQPSPKFIQKQRSDLMNYMGVEHYENNWKKTVQLFWCL